MIKTKSHLKNLLKNKNENDSRNRKYSKNEKMLLTAHFIN